MFQGTYISSLEALRDLAAEWGFDNIGLHPNHIGVPEAGDYLLIDLDNVLFGDKAGAIDKAIEHASRGVKVGVHSINLGGIRLPAQPPIAVGKTFDDVMSALLGCAVPTSPPPLPSDAEADDLELWFRLAQEEIAESRGHSPSDHRQPPVHK